MAVSIKCGLAGFLIQVGSGWCVINHFFLLFYRYTTLIFYSLYHCREDVYQEITLPHCNICRHVWLWEKEVMRFGITELWADVAL